MRRNLFSPVLACVLLLGGITASIGQTTTHIDFTNQWSYLVTNALPPGGWTNVNYAAAAGWPVGAGPFAYPADEAMPGGVPALRTLLATNFNNNFVTSFYFRTTFNLPSNPSNAVFTARAVIDDGAVFYVNGRRVQNVRVTAGAVTHNTLATGDGGGDVDSRPLDTFAIASSNFVQGANTIAVSVHQSSGTSSDVAFALELQAETIQPPVIVTQPESQTVTVGQRATFEVEADGSFLTYRWYTNGVFIFNSNTNAYTTPTATLSMDGLVYHVVVSNVLGRVQSVPVVLRVVPDTFGPIATNALIVRSNWVEVEFDEVLHPGPVTNAGSLNNFSVMVLETGEELTVTNATLSAARRDVTLRLVETLSSSTNYVVCVRNMHDTLTNITAQSCIGVGFPTTNVITAFEGGWAFNYDSGPPPANWTAVNFSLPSTWVADGRAPFFQDQVFSGGSLCGAQPGLAIDALFLTYYFRQTFTIPAGTDLSRPVNLQYLVDDGAVFYLNGTEIHRYNMPGGTVTHTTRALQGREANCTTAFNGNLSSLLRTAPNVNVLAVSVHQWTDEGPLNNDVVFDARLRFGYLDAPVIPELTIVTNTTNIRITWPIRDTSPSWVLESAPSITGPWVPNTYTRVGASNVFQSAIGSQPTNRFFRMRIP